MKATINFLAVCATLAIVNFVWFNVDKLPSFWALNTTPHMVPTAHAPEEADELVVKVNHEFQNCAHTLAETRATIAGPEMTTELAAAIDEMLVFNGYDKLSARSRFEKYFQVSDTSGMAQRFAKESTKVRRCLASLDNAVAAYNQSREATLLGGLGKFVTSPPSEALSASIDADHTVTGSAALRLMSGHFLSPTIVRLIYCNDWTSTRAQPSDFIAELNDFCSPQD